MKELYVYPHNFETHYDGMTLRDYFAANASDDEVCVPDSYSGCEALLGLAPGQYSNDKHWPLVRAKARYLFADAMLKAREG